MKEEIFAKKGPDMYVQKRVQKIGAKMALEKSAKIGPDEFEAERKKRTETHILKAEEANNLPEVKNAAKKNIETILKSDLIDPKVKKANFDKISKKWVNLGVLDKDDIEVIKTKLYSMGKNN